MKKLVPHFFVKSVSENINFYKNLLGFRLEYVQPEGGEPDFAILNKGDVEIMIGDCKSLTHYMPEFENKPPASSTIFYIEMTGVEDYYNRIKPNVTIVKDIMETWYHTIEFWIRDCNGYVLAFYENL